GIHGDSEGGGAGGRSRICGARANREYGGIPVGPRYRCIGALICRSTRRPRPVAGPMRSFPATAQAAAGVGGIGAGATLRIPVAKGGTRWIGQKGQKYRQSSAEILQSTFHNWVLVLDAATRSRVKPFMVPAAGNKQRKEPRPSH